jgi:hypothetical protein
MLKVKHSCIELSLLTKCGSETSNWSWIRSQTSGEVQPPCDPKNFDDCAIKGQVNDDLSLWSPRNHHDRVPRETSVTAVYYRIWMQKSHRKMHKNRPDLLGDGNSFCTTMHTHTWRRVRPICYASMSGKCYLMRHTVQTWVHWTSTYSTS